MHHRICSLILSIFFSTLFAWGQETYDATLITSARPDRTTPRTGDINVKGQAVLIYQGNSAQLWLPESDYGAQSGITDLLTLDGLVTEPIVAVEFTNTGHFVLQGTQYYGQGALVKTAPVLPNMQKTILLGINNHGEAVGTSSRPPGPLENPWEYSFPVMVDRDSIRDLSTSLPPALEPKFPLYSPHQINDGGQLLGRVSNYNLQDSSVDRGIFSFGDGQRAFLWEADYPGFGDLYPLDLNNDGAFFFRHPAREIGLYLTVPTNPWGTDGYVGNLIGPTTGGLPNLNENMQGTSFIYPDGDGAAPLYWDRGNWINVQSLSIIQEGFTPFRVHDINYSGQLLVSGFVPDDTAEHFFILTPKTLRTSITIEPTDVDIGEVFDVTFTIHNSTEDRITGVSLGPDGIRPSGSAVLAFAGNLPSAIDLDPGQTGTFVIRMQADAHGSAFLLAEVAGTDPEGTQIVSATARSNTVRVRVKADLLIKKQDDPDSAFAMNDVYLRSPVLRQRITEFLDPADSIDYELKVENDLDVAATFTLKAVEKDAEDWTIEYFQLGEDIGNALQSSEGWETPELQAGESLRILFSMQSPNVPEEMEAEVLFALLPSANELVAADSVSLTATTRDVIIVNDNGDDKDADPGDGVIDTDINTEGEQITLRAAIDFANEREGKDRIEFDMPDNTIRTFSSEGTRPDFNLFGQSLKKPLEFAMKTTDAVIIDGTTQPGGRVFLYGGGGLDYDFGGIAIAGPDSEIKGFGIYLFGGFGLSLLGPGGTRVSNVWIGIDESRQPKGNGSKFDGVFLNGDEIAGGLFIESPLNEIGGSALGEANIIVGNYPTTNVGIAFGADDYIGAELILHGRLAFSNRIFGNYIGVDQNSQRPPGLPRISPLDLWLYEAENNQIEANTTIGLTLTDSDNNLIVGNQIGVSKNGTSAIQFADGIRISGNNNLVSENLIYGSGWSVNLHEGRNNGLFGNRINLKADADEPLLGSSDLEGEVLVYGEADSGFTFGGTGEGDANSIYGRMSDDSSPLILVLDSPSSAYFEFIGNKLVIPNPGRTSKPIFDLNSDSVITENDTPDIDGIQNAPLLGSAKIDGGELVVTGSLGLAQGFQSFIIDFYAVTVSHPSGHGGSMHYIGSTEVDTPITSIVDFEFRRPTGGDISLSNLICATATNKAKQNTSEFSNNQPVDDVFFFDSDGISDGQEQQIGDGNEDNTSDHLQNNVTSFYSVNGLPNTLVVEEALALENVAAESQSSVSAPSTHFYPGGLTSFELSGLDNGASANVQLLQAAGSTGMVLFSRDENGNWIDSLPFTGNEEGASFSLIDGGLGDQDGTANGRIVATLGLARSNPSEIPVNLQATSDSLVISWSTSEPFDILESSTNLIEWDPVNQEPVLNGEQLQIEIPLAPEDSDQPLFLRLRSLP